MSAFARIPSGAFSVTERRLSWARAMCVIVVAIQIPLIIGLYRQSTWATDMWPLPDVRMTYHFIASILATTATLHAWAAWRNEMGGLRTIGLVAATSMPAISVYLLWIATDRTDSGLAFAGVIFLTFGAIFALIGWWARGVPIRDPRRLPAPFRAVFIGFCCILIPVGAALVLQVEDIFPWRLSPENSTVIGLIFLGAAVLFGWIVAHPRWAYGEMALTGFLAYDLSLLMPYLDLLRNRNDTETIASYYGDTAYQTTASDNGLNELSLAVYLSVMAISAVAAVGIYVWGYRTQPMVEAAVAD